MEFKISNPAINERTIIEILNTGNKEYAARLYRQLVHLLTNTHYFKEEELINDYFTMLRLGLYLNTESIYFSITSFISYMERRFKNLSEDSDESFYESFALTINYIDSLIEKETNLNSLVNLKQFKTRLISNYRKQHIKLMNN